MKLLAGQTAIVTGGGQGIGKGIAIELAKAGCNLIIAQRNQKHADQVVAEIKSLGKDALAIKLDVTDSTSVNNCIVTALTFAPKIDILVNNAGIMQSEIGSDISEESFDQCYQVNVKGLWRMNKALANHFQTHENGKIINISSIGGREPDASFPIYCASKAAVLSLTKSLAHELGPYNINVNALCPGTVVTPMWETVESLTSKGQPNDQITAYSSSINSSAIKRSQSPKDVGYAAVFLASPLARNITGQALNVDGGQIMS
jgi:NAD(P)-dependent dehydrogenase (short-subunit alcohol dehydrogenase family)